MENAEPMNSKLIFRPAEYEYVQTLSKFDIDGKPVTLKYECDFQNIGKRWKGTYGFIGMNVERTGILAHGMNTEGLTVGAMTLLETQYQEIPNITDENIISYPYLVIWILSQYRTCDEVKNNLHKELVINPYIDVPEGLLFHFPVNDSFGGSIVIEFIGGKMTISDNTNVGVLTNDPSLEWQLTNLNCYDGVTPVNAIPFEGTNFSTASGSQGTGFANLPGSSTPPDRFVRAAMMTNYSYPVSSTERATTLAFHILNTVDIPLGTSRTDIAANSANNKSDFTQWIVVANLKDRIYSVRMYDSPQVFSVDLCKLDLKGLQDVLYEIPVEITSTSLTQMINQKTLKQNPCISEILNKQTQSQIAAL